MKILLVTNAYPPAIGGAEIACKRIVDILSKKHEVTLITKKDGLNRRAENEKEIIELEAKTIYSYMPKLKEVLESKEYDLYISFGFGKYFFDYIGKWCKKNRKKCLSLPIGYFHTKNALFFKEAYRKLFAKNSLDNYDLLITATEQEKNFWNKEFGINKEKIRVIPHTMEENYTSFSPTNILKNNNLKPSQYIFYIGRVAKNKRPDLLIKAFGGIETELKLVIAGKGTKNEELQNIAGKNALFLGDISDDEKKELIKNARLCVFPSEYESYGLFIVEAIEFDTPIIASNIAVFREIIKNEDYLFENTPEALRKKLKQFIKYPKKLTGFKKINQTKEYLSIVDEITKKPKKLNIFMQYPWIVADSPYYKYLFDYPPENANYLNPVIKSRDVITNKNKLKTANQLKNIIRVTAINQNLPLPNVRATFKKNCDLIHSAHCISITNKPWVVDLEGYWQIVIGRAGNKLAVSMAKRILEMNNCKKIMCWTNETKEKLTEITKSEKIKQKSIVVYPAVPAQMKVKQGKTLNLLFIARYFYEKGGKTAVKAIDELTKNNKNVGGIIVSDTPEEILKEYSKNKKIKFLPLMTREKLFKEAYSKSNIFIYPGYSDSFGFALLEAMSFGLPIVTVNGIARKEIVEENKTGYVIDHQLDKSITKEAEERFVREIISKTNILIHNEALRKEIGKNAYNQISSGKFSISQRNKLMEKIYEETLTK